MSPLPPRPPGTALRVSAGPAVWLDAGDLTVGPVRALAGETPWADIARLPIAAAAAGNHEFDHGVPALLEGAAALPFPLLSARIDVGLPGSAVVETAAGPLGVIGIGHPRNDRLSGGPAPSPGWERRIAPVAAELRGQGARWVVALLHDGADWWPQADGIGTRARRLERATAAWAGSVDLILGGHTLGAWSGRLAGTPAGHAHPFAASVLVVDLSPDRAAEVRGWVRVPVRVAAPSPAIAVLDGAAGQIVADNPAPWLSRPDAARYLPRLVARALREASGADAGLAIGSQHATQAPLDGWWPRCPPVRSASS